jgi:hypothetical protein
MPKSQPRFNHTPLPQFDHLDPFGYVAKKLGPHCAHQVMNAG